MEISSLGDSALLIRLRDDFADAPDESLAKVLSAAQRLNAAALPGLIELAPAYTSIGLFFDPLRVIEAGAPRDGVLEWLAAKIRNELAGRPKQRKRPPAARIVEIPVCYEREFAPDLEEVARHGQLPVDEIIRRHSSAQYRVHCVGFTPGFPFLGGLPSELAMPRRAEPRLKIPAGSVAIGGAQTGIYPLSSPGGWNVIGRTPLRLFDVLRDPPALLRTGDRVRFRTITREKFEDLKQ
jgi:inhibitor of KinA